MQGNKLILATFEKGNNKYYDSTFNIRPRIPPNSKGLYSVEINEFCFKNNEPTLEKDDWIEFLVYNTDLSTGESKIDIIRFEVLYDTYTYNDSSIKQIVDTLKEFNVPNDKATRMLKTKDDGKWFSGIEIKYLDYEGNLQNISGASIGNNWYLYLKLEDIINKTVNKVTMRFSNNFCYLFNSLTVEKPSYYYSTNKSYIFNFMNMRLEGPYLYLLDTSPLQSEFVTLNANNEAYNITALSYNSSAYHNGIIQGSSSMRCKTKDLSNLRVRLLNDQFETVKIKEPLYLQITITNED